VNRRRWPWVLGALLVLVIAAGAVALTWFGRQVRPPGPVGAEVTVTVARGATPAAIAQTLEEAEVIRSARFFEFYLKRADASRIEAGDFVLRQSEDLDTVVGVLTSGAAIKAGQRLTIPEGLTLGQVAEVVGRLPGRSAAAFTEAVKSGTVRSRYQPQGQSLEGYVLPETYEVGARETEAQILARLVGAFDGLATDLDLTAAARRLGVTPHQAVVIASLVEREAKVDIDRGPIARVIYNRLARGMPLQIDATVQFALGVNKPRLLLSDLKVDSPYNTYRIPGLPPGPIAGPGRAALSATLSPTPGSWIYYVLTDADGRHAFATTSAEFERFKAESARKGLL